MWFTCWRIWPRLQSFVCSRAGCRRYVLVLPVSPWPKCAVKSLAPLLQHPDPWRSLLTKHQNWEEMNSWSSSQIIKQPPYLPCLNLDRFSSLFAFDVAFQTDSRCETRHFLCNPPCFVYKTMTCDHRWRKQLLFMGKRGTPLHTPPTQSITDHKFHNVIQWELARKRPILYL